MARTMQDFPDIVFINMANLILIQRDSQVDYLKAGVKHDILAALRNSPPHMTSLFPDSMLMKADKISRPRYILSSLNKYLKSEKFKMETPERTLQKGEWVTLIDFKDAYFHIPINPQSRKKLHFQVLSYQFKALPLLQCKSLW